MSSTIFHASVLSLLLLLSLLSSSLAMQAVCDNGNAVLPCPSVLSEWNQWGLTWRNYTSLAIAGKGVFNPHNSTLETIRVALPTLESYIHGDNGQKAVLNQTIPIGVLMENAGNQTAYVVFFFLPDANVASPPAFTNSTGFLHLNTWPTKQATFSPIVYSYLDRATDANIQSNLALLESQLQTHKQTYNKGLTAFVTYGLPHGDVQQNEVWVFASNPFPGHLADVVAPQHKAAPRKDSVYA